ncbi:MAG: polysulfide reductase NrfD [Firmicutes bacterium]|nr:polysulfide reductase NrfD [Bacillota bacterium]
MHGEVLWNVYIAIYLFLAGISAGSAVLAAVNQLFGIWEEKVTKAAAYVAPFPVMGGLLALVLDLSRPLNFYQVMLHYNWTSVMSWGVVFLNLFPPVALLFAVSHFTGWFEKYRKALAVAVMALGVGIGTYAGLLLAAISANPLWGNPVLGVLFLVSALSTGVCAAMLVAQFVFKVSHQSLKGLAVVDSTLIILELVVIAVLLIGWAVAPTGGKALQILLAGEYAGIFLGGVLVFGLLVPLALNLLELGAFGKARHIPAVAPLLVLVGGYFLRHVIVYAGQAIYPLLLG